MSFGGGGGGSSSIAGSTDVFLSAVADNEVLTYNGGTLKWVNDAAQGGGGSVDLSNIPAGSTLTVAKVAGAWPARPTSRADIVVQWKGPDPSPPIVSSGTGGMLDDVDIRLVTT